MAKSREEIQKILRTVGGTFTAARRRAGPARRARLPALVRPWIAAGPEAPQKRAVFRSPIMRPDRQVARPPTAYARRIPESLPVGRQFPFAKSVAAPMPQMDRGCA